MDFVSDLLDRVAGALALPDEVRDMLDTGIRQDWGGERPYVAKRGEVAGACLSRRNRAIIRDHKAGERQACLARKYGLSKSAISKIIQG